MGLGLGTAGGTDQLRGGLNRHEKVRYTNNGNRATTAEVFLKRIAPIMPLIGVTRVGDISHLASFPFPVVQTTRPNLNYHFDLGINSGSQGKGMNLRQAMISSMMESIEGYCAEPKNVQMIRGTYQWLRGHRRILPPQALHYLPERGAPSEDEPLMWTSAYSVKLDDEILVPAEAVYFPFRASAYKTKGHFPCTTNGLSSGGNFLEAVVHGIYEIIERGYLALFELGQAEVRCLWENEIPGVDIKDYYQQTGKEYEVQLFTLHNNLFPRDLPMVVCKLVGSRRRSVGFGCSGNVEMSIHRAFSEALQTEAVRVSGSREDLVRHPSKAKPTLTTERDLRRDFRAEFLPQERNLRLAEFKKMVIDRDFRDLRQEYDFLIAWLKKAGCADVLIANLTRLGIDIPVVKVIVPGIPHQKLDVDIDSSGLSDARMFRW